MTDNDPATSAGGSSRLSWFGPLERRLFLIVLIGLLPLTLLSVGTLYQSAQRQRQQLLTAAENQMHAVIGSIDAQLQSSVGALQTLAASPRLANGDLNAFREEAGKLLSQRSDWANVVLSDLQLQHVVNLKVPPGDPLPKAVYPEGSLPVIESKRPVIGGVIQSKVLRGPAFAVLVPALQGERVTHVLSAVVKPSSVTELLSSQRLPELGVAVVLDRTGVVVARSRNHPEWVGRPASPSLVELISDGKASGWNRGVTLEDVPVYSVYARSASTGWVAAIGLPQSVLDAPVRRSFMVLAAALVLSVLLGLAVAALVARTITRPMRQLEVAAAQVGRGQRPEPPATELPEVRQVHVALVDAHAEREALLLREREAVRSAEEARAQAEAASRTKDEFLAMLAHELRNPLAAISSASRLLDMLDLAPDKAAGEHARGVIRRQVKHMAQLTDDLLNVGRVMTGKIEIKRAAIDLAQAAASTLRVMQGTGALAGHRVEADLRPAWVDADQARLEQVISNLLSNAVKYTPGDGSIQLTVRRDGQQAVLRVSDSGVGIEPELLPRVFDLFVQGKRSLDRSQGGLGIGLTLVQRLVELHGGTVSAASGGPGQGSVFEVRLPSIAPAGGTASEASEPGQVQRLSVVLVEDNDDVRATLRRLLEMRGHAVYEAADGHAGVDEVVRRRPDVALIDIGLPGLDGYAVARALRARFDGKLRLIAVTGYGSESEVEYGLAAGFDEYLVKPVDLAALQRVLEEPVSSPGDGADAR